MKKGITNVYPVLKRAGIELSEDGHNRVTVRPSGTEPKIKFYNQTYEPFDENIIATKEKANERSEAIRTAIDGMVASL